ncbi:hypothetical protein [Sphingomonas turrisvirgatae]|uniref:Uncharacterized protein n=1 Tax=Sphingomonas turrisvirgatae TaxID=1888892 RepID=A0A1E3M0B2_9SPHN|nr:hypothetical protein [Sphingomonas turrisvirgatae]ODP39408.1 hypothetical protein BFL28_10005 [Sphingomonas turrisvirgatae]
MSLFEFTFALSAVILGLALTHIAATIHKLLLLGKQVKWAIEPVLLAAIVILLIVSVWLGAWGDREQAEVTVGQTLLQVAKLLTLYFAAASCLPEPVVAEPIDLRSYYDSTRLLSFGSLVLSLLLFRIYSIAIDGIPSVLTIGMAVNMILYPVLYVSMIFVRRRWFNILTLGFIIVYYGWQVAGQQLIS